MSVQSLKKQAQKAFVDITKIAHEIVTSIFLSSSLKISIERNLELYLFFRF